MLPSIRVMTIAAADPALFENLMRQAGFRLARRNTDPLNNQVQVESVQAVASAMMEGNYFGVRLDPYRRKLKTLAESRGYVVVIENCGPPGADPCEGDLPPGPDGPPGMSGEMPVAEVGEGEALLADNPEGTEMPMGPEEDMASGPSEVEQVASLPIGTELAQQILDVIQGKGTAALDEPDMDEPGMEMMTDDDEFGDGPVEGPLDGEEESNPFEEGLGRGLRNLATAGAVGLAAMGGGCKDKASGPAQQPAKTAPAAQGKAPGTKWVDGDNSGPSGQYSGDGDGVPVTKNKPKAAGNSHVFDD